MSEHTKTPWAVSEHLEVGPVSREMDQTNGFVIPVADVYGDNMHDDAYFIVKAVNNHERLVEALHHVIAVAEFRDYTDPALVKARALLAEIEEGE